MVVEGWAARLGNVLFWFGTALAVLLFAVAAAVAYDGASIEGIILIIGVGLVAWLSGWAARYVLRGFSDSQPQARPDRVCCHLDAVRTSAIASADETPRRKRR